MKGSAPAEGWPRAEAVIDRCSLSCPRVTVKIGQTWNLLLVGIHCRHPQEDTQASDTLMKPKRTSSINASQTATDIFRPVRKTLLHILEYPPVGVCDTLLNSEGCSSVCAVMVLQANLLRVD